jgi:hypothetical protein
MVQPSQLVKKEHNESKYNRQNTKMEERGEEREEKQV